MIENTALRTTVYTLYQLNEIQNSSAADISAALKAYADYSADFLHVSPDQFTFTKYISLYGINGKELPDFEKFITTVYRDENYMKSILPETLLIEYHEDIKTLNTKGD